MLKFVNRHPQRGEFLTEISMTSVQGGVDVHMWQGRMDRSDPEEYAVLLTPTEAACFVDGVKRSSGKACMALGHGYGHSEGATMAMHEVARGTAEGEWEFVGDFAEVGLRVGGLIAYVPTWIPQAMRLAVENMMDSLMYPSTGDMEEEFA